MPAPRSWRGAKAGRPTCPAGRCASSRIAIRCCASRARRACDPSGLFESRDGLGAHEVIVETPIHDQPLHTLDADHLWRVLWAWRTRIQDLKRDSRFASIVIFKNHGRAAGARLDHSHSQLTAYPLIPPALADKLRGAARHLSKTGKCIFCDLIAQEVTDGRRIIRDQDSILAIAPYASRVPFETWLDAARSHAALRGGVRRDAPRARRRRSRR